MVMRDHAVSNRLVRYDFLRLGDDGLRPHFILRPWFEKQNVVCELDGEGVVRAVDTKDAIRQLLRRRAGGRLLTAAGRRRSARSASTLRSRRGQKLLDVRRVFVG